MKNYKYKSLVGNIIALDWERLGTPELRMLMVLSAYAAREFAESLRIAIELNPNNEGLRKMASEELKTCNLRFDDYHQAGDHGDFLWHFIRRHGLIGQCPAEVFKSGERYHQEVRAMDPRSRVMSIVSREQELPGIFQRVLSAKSWDSPELKAFRYYLERHIALDTGDDGHASMLDNFPVDDQVAKFYETRLAMYEAIPSLF